jgi:hypothetical protein
MIEHNFRLKKEHLDIFETGLIILLSKIIEKKDNKNFLKKQLKNLDLIY